MSESKSIVLLRSTSRKCWLAYHYGNGFDSLIEAFGTHVLPTAFTASAQSSEVLAKIKALNPTAKVSFMDSAEIAPLPILASLGGEA